MRKFSKWIIILAGAIITVLLLRGFLFTSYSIPSAGMENTLLRGDNILVNKWSYGLRVPIMSLFSYHRWNQHPVKFRDIVVFNNPAQTDEPLIDKRSIYVNRCIGLPGDTLVMDSLLQISSWKKSGPDRKNLYYYTKQNEPKVDSLLHALSITGNELMGTNDSVNIRNFSRYEYYLLEQVMADSLWIVPLTSEKENILMEWVVPGKGMNIQILPWNATLYHNTIALHEGRNTRLSNDTLFIDGKQVSSYTFTKDYYWMGADNSVNLSDSRLFGLVPHDHLIGKANYIWFSKEPETGIMGGYRWNRFFTKIK